MGDDVLALLCLLLVAFVLGGLGSALLRRRPSQRRPPGPPRINRFGEMED